MKQGVTPSSAALVLTTDIFNNFCSAQIDRLMSAKSPKNSSDDGGADGPIIIKKYPNRRLYNTATSGYIVLDDIVDLIRQEADFVIVDQKTGEDITRSILNQIIYEREIRDSHFHFPLDVQKHFIALYDNDLADLMPDFLSRSLKMFTEQKEGEAPFSQSGYQSDEPGETDHATSDFQSNASAMMAFSENLARQNMELFQKSWDVFGSFTGMKNPFSALSSPGQDEDVGSTDRPTSPAPTASHPATPEQPTAGSVKEQMKENKIKAMQDRIDEFQAQLEALKKSS